MPVRQKLKQTGSKRESSSKRTVAQHLKNHFVPQADNNYLPHALKHRALLVYSAFIVATKTVLVMLALVLPSASLYSFEITGASVVKLTNEARQAVGLSDVSVNQLLTGAAQAKADDMLARQYFSHEGPEGESPWYWLKNSGYRYKSAGENLAIHYTDSEALGQSWLASPSHRANILDSKFKEIGIGVARGKIEGYESIVVVQLFAAPSLTKTVQNPATNPINNSTDARIMGTSIGLKNDRIVISIKAPATASVSGQVGETLIPFTFDQTSLTWIGTLDPQTELGDSRKIVATVQTPDAPALTAPIALVVEKSQVQNLYRAQSIEDTKLLGLTIDGLGDSTRRLYIYLLVTLSALLLINIFVKFEIQHPKIVAHTLLVMGLAFFFSFI